MWLYDQKVNNCFWMEGAIKSGRTGPDEKCYMLLQTEENLCIYIKIIHIMGALQGLLPFSRTFGEEELRTEPPTTTSNHLQWMTKESPLTPDQQLPPLMLHSDQFHSHSASLSAQFLRFQNWPEPYKQKNNNTSYNSRHMEFVMTGIRRKGCFFCREVCVHVESEPGVVGS